jgi:hypothetical protein
MMTERWTVVFQNRTDRVANLSHTLRLTTDSGILLCRTELPTVVKGAKALDEERVTNALLTHVNRHANEIGLAGLGAITMQATGLEPYVFRAAIASFH